MQLFFDLDGTLIDISQKYYHVYSDCIIKLNGTPLDNKTYWQHKRNGLPTRLLLHKSNVPVYQESVYSSLFVSTIETPQYLVFDTKFDYSTEVLTALKQEGHLLYIVSARRNTDTAMAQISKMGLSPLMEHIDMTGHDGKTIALRRLIVEGNPWIGISDTEGDINCYNDAGGVSVAVLNGLRTKSTLMNFCSPMRVISDIRKLPILVDNISKKQ